ncbi:pyridoxamine 5'-phosphate oxidase family protein [Cellulophaga sp. L1A9]|uniref:pyridoxamine 5'-phosphate oxidase family protein n=1 Tax=Cellulophaga sp. L1A9 TaxID=2686362 RepID=UPI00131E824A|nr:pyridoxamine 5'-phosphate oxidase family protein [Cellulophaga sp. L1A9]
MSYFKTSKHIIFVEAISRLLKTTSITSNKMTDLSKSQSISILIQNYFGNLGVISQNIPYVIPITYYFDKEEGSIISYTADGLKLKAMRKNKHVSLAVQEITSVNNWQSVLVHGTFEELTGIDAKQKLHEFSEGVKKLIFEKENKEAEFISEFSNKSYSKGIPTVFRINITEITGKRKEM